MKRIAIFCVTYNTYDELSAYLNSIEQSARQAIDVAEVSVYVADNTESAIQTIDFSSDILTVRCFNFHKNYGYFGALERMMNEIDTAQFDYVILSNVDITMDENAIKALCLFNDTENVGWIAPQIYSDLEHRDRNPSVMHRYSRSKLRLLLFMYECPLAYWLYKNTLYKRKKLQSKPTKAADIYAGHGSYIILTQAYFQRAGAIDYPVFLYGEELYLAEQCRENALKVVYYPSMRIYDKEHASTKSLDNKFYFRCNRDAIRFILNRFYK